MKELGERSPRKARIVLRSVGDAHSSVGKQDPDSSSTLQHSFFPLTADCPGKCVCFWDTARQDKVPVQVMTRWFPKLSAQNWHEEAQVLIQYQQCLLFPNVWGWFRTIALQTCSSFLPSVRRQQIL